MGWLKFREYPKTICLYICSGCLKVISQLVETKTGYEHLAVRDPSVLQFDERVTVMCRTGVELCNTCKALEKI